MDQAGQCNLTTIARVGRVAALAVLLGWVPSGQAESRDVVEEGAAVTPSAQALPEAIHVDLKSVTALPVPQLEMDAETAAGQNSEASTGEITNSVSTDPTDRAPETVSETNRPLFDGEGEEADVEAAILPIAKPGTEDANQQTGAAMEEAHPMVPQEPVGPPVPEDLDSLYLLGTRIAPSTTTRLAWSPNVSFSGITAPTPVLVVNGARPGPTLCLTAAIHGDELNGIEIVRRLLYDIDVAKLQGAIIGVPIVNLQGFHRGSRYLADRRDLNRHFPGNPRGSVAARIAYSFFEEIVRQCDALVDLHTGSFHRTNLPQIRADLNRPEVKALSQKFGATAVLHSSGGEGTLRRAAVEAGIPAVTIEAGEPLRLQEKEVSHGVKSLRSLLDQLNMYSRFSLWGAPEPVYYKSVWIRADTGGILLSNVKLGSRVDRGALLGTVVDPITNASTEIHSPFAGRVLGMAVNQVVMPGYAAYHIGVRAEPTVLPDEESEERGDIIPPVSPELPADELEYSEE